MNGVVSLWLGGIWVNKLEVFFGVDVVNKINENGSEMMFGKCESWNEQWWWYIICSWIFQFCDWWNWLNWNEMKGWCRMVFVCLNGVVGVSGMHRWCWGGACMCMSVWVSEVVFVRNGCYCVCRVWMSAEKSPLGVLGCPYHQNNSLSEWGRWSLSRFFSRSRGAREDLNIPLDRGLSALHLMRSPLEPVIHTFL